MAVRYRTVDMHVAGEPARIVVEGYENIQGRTILEKRRYAQSNLDHIRRCVMLEPRGHKDMYGAVPVLPSGPDADIGVIFMHNSGYAMLCGHAILAVARWAVESGRVRRTDPLTKVRLECPSGIVDATVEFEDDGRVRSSFESLPALPTHLDTKVSTPSFGDVVLDISYGGSIWAIIPASALGITLKSANLDVLVAAGTEIARNTREQVKIWHPTIHELSILAGTIITDDAESESAEPSSSITIFGQGDALQVDRSPTGSGICARLGRDYLRGRVALGERRTFIGPSGQTMSGEVMREVVVGERKAAIVEVTGYAQFTGEHNFIVEDNDPLANGFTLAAPFG